ncbi:MAG: UDP-galactopyranose mutase [Myxococcota bacterium]
MDPRPPDVDVLVVGLGFAGATVARALADEGWRVHAVERRRHIAGNAFDELDAAGVRIHRYGPHAFHTSAPRVVEHLSRFTGWRPYEHRVRAFVRGQLVPFPINRTTINMLTGQSLDQAGAAAWLAAAREPRQPVRNSEDLVLGAVGRELCELFYRGYSKKHWDLDLSELAVGVAARIPVRSDDDDRYFDDSFQAMPADGYTRLFERILSHPRLSFEIGRGLELDDFVISAGAAGGRADAVPGRAPRFRQLVWTGPIDALFDHAFGRLPYRSVRFEHVHLPDVAWAQPVAQINYPNDFDYYRVTELKHMTGQVHPGTSLVREYPQAAAGEPHYPIPRAENEALYRRYRERAEALENVTLVGRLAQYRYYNMDQVVAAALTAAGRINERLRRA